MNYLLPILEKALAVIGLLVMTTFLAIRLRNLTYKLLHPRAPTWAGFLSNIVQILVLVSGLGLIVYIAGINTAVILTVVAIFTAGLSLALDGSVRDLIATTKLLAFGYYKVGDRVTLDGHTGKVTEITAFSTILETPSRDTIIIGNKEIVDKIIMNHTVVKGRTVLVTIPVRDAPNREQVIHLLLDVAQRCPDRLADTEFAPDVFYEVTPDYEKYSITIVIGNEGHSGRIASWLALEAANRLQENGIRLGRERVIL